MAEMRWLAAAAALISVPGCGGECSAVCETSVTLTAMVDRPVDALAGTSLVYCRNGACSLPTPFVDGGQIRSGGLCASMFVAGQQPSMTEVDVHLDLATHDCALPKLQDGDRYALTITDPDGATIANDAAIASYHAVSSCGTHCQELILELAPSS